MIQHKQLRNGQKMAAAGTVVILVASLLTLISSRISARSATEVETGTFLPVVMIPDEFRIIVTPATFVSVTDISNAGDDRLFVAERAGTIRILHPDGSSSLFLDIRDRVDSDGAELGLFGLAFHPDYPNNGYFYVTYTTPRDGTGWSLKLSQFQVTSNPDVAAPDSEIRIINVRQDFAQHNGGALEFNPLDGKIYLGVGDDEELLTAQDRSTSKGKILQIDVDIANVGRNIGIERQINEDTIVAASVMTEQWARGLRNPWKIGVDPLTGDMFVGDVGDRSWEEINLIPFGQSGQNFGWPCMEGPDIKDDGGPCNRNFDLPVYYYSNGCYIVVGEVYRHPEDPAEDGRLLFGDGCRSEIFALSQVPGGWQAQVIGDRSGTPEGLLTTFGKNDEGTVFAGLLGPAKPLLELHIPSQ